MGLLRLSAATCAVAAFLLAPAAAEAVTPTVWLCKPGVANDPCASPLTTTVIDRDGDRRVKQDVPSRRPQIDCFFVYPTVSGQPTPNADLTIDPEVRAIAEWQAARFSQHCRVFAPVYRQLTLAAIGTPRAGNSPEAQIAYSDVRDAWKEYLAQHNQGRGVVLIGHSQGTYMLRQLVKFEIDPRRVERRRLVSALLLGGNVEVLRNSDRGGDFRAIRACRRPTQTGCVVAYSMFAKKPPRNSRFARTRARGRQILCTNPAALGGGSARVDAYSRTTPFPGVLGVGINNSTTLPAVSTPWVAFPQRAQARCVSRDGATWLHVTPRARDRRPVFRQAIGDDWGLHLGDINIAYGQLVHLVGQQAEAYLRRRR